MVGFSGCGRQGQMSHWAVEKCMERSGHGVRKFRDSGRVKGWGLAQNLALSAFGYPPFANCAKSGAPGSQTRIACTLSRTPAAENLIMPAVRFPPFANCAKDGAPAFWFRQQKSKAGPPAVITPVRCIVDVLGVSALWFELDEIVNGGAEPVPKSLERPLLLPTT